MPRPRRAVHTLEQLPLAWGGATSTPPTTTATAASAAPAAIAAAGTTPAIAPPADTTTAAIAPPASPATAIATAAPSTSRRAATPLTVAPRPPMKAPHPAVQRPLLRDADDARPLAKVVAFGPRRDAKLRRAGQTTAPTADDWYERGCELEESDVVGAVDAYGHALALDATHAPTLLNVGRLHHAQGAFALAEDAYRRALAVDADWGTAAFNLGVVLEDAQKRGAAIAAYEQACAARRPCVDAHFNVARLYEDQGDRQAALRHLMAYRRFVR